MTSNMKPQPRKTIWKVSDCPALTPCSQEWEALQVVPDNSKVRYCSECQQSVYRCDTQAEFREHRALGHCISIEVEMPDRTTTNLLGASPYGAPSKLEWD